MSGEIDKEIAEKVMGWKPIWVCGYSESHFIGGHFNTSEECEKFCERGQKPILIWETEKGWSRGLGEGFKPSKNISDAWLVVEKMKEQLFSKRNIFANELQRVISRGMGIEEGKLIGWQSIILHMTPITICLAALKAMEVNENPV